MGRAIVMFQLSKGIRPPGGTTPAQGGLDKFRVDREDSWKPVLIRCDLGQSPSSNQISTAPPPQPWPIEEKWRHRLRA
jgi:hypothetical protein